MRKEEQEELAAWIYVICTQGKDMKASMDQIMEFFKIKRRSPRTGDKCNICGCKYGYHSEYMRRCPDKTGLKQWAETRFKRHPGDGG